MTKQLRIGEDLPAADPLLLFSANGLGFSQTKSWTYATIWKKQGDFVKVRDENT